MLAGGPGARRGGADPLVAEALASAGHPTPRVAYVGAPSGDNRAFYTMIARLLRLSGAGRVDNVRLAGRSPDLPAARAAIEAADIVFFTGGDVEQGMCVIERTGMVPALRARHEAGIPFLGVSAGSIMLARGWVRWASPDNDASASVFDCLGCAPLYCDTHGEGDGWQELITLLGLAAPDTVGYGIPTSTGLRVAADGTVSARGGPVHRFRRAEAGVVRIDDLSP
jgi:cyanophycinase-like exopeptidase